MPTMLIIITCAIAMTVRCNFPRGHYYPKCVYSYKTVCTFTKNCVHYYIKCVCKSTCNYNIHITKVCGILQQRNSVNFYKQKLRSLLQNCIHFSRNCVHYSTHFHLHNIGNFGNNLILQHKLTMPKSLLDYIFVSVSFVILHSCCL